MIRDTADTRTYGFFCARKGSIAAHALVSLGYFDSTSARTSAQGSGEAHANTRATNKDTVDEANLLRLETEVILQEKLRARRYPVRQWPRGA